MRMGTPGFRGERLREAREARSLTGAALAESVGVSRAAVSQYERGVQTPAPDVFTRIADALRLPERFFLENSEEVAGGTVFFRCTASATKAARARAERRYRWTREIVRHLQRHLRFPEVDLPEIDLPSKFAALTPAIVEDAAAAVRRHWGLGDGPISNVVWLLENKGVVVTRHLLKSDRLDAFSNWDEDEPRPYIVLGTDKGSAVRSRFDAAHELAHLVLHRHVNQGQLAKRADFALIESQAHRFAGAFLLPATTFLNDLHGVSLDALREMKPHWRAAIQLMLKRAQDLGVVSDAEAKRLWINIGRRGWRKREPFDDRFEPERPRFLPKCFEMLLDRGVLTREGLAADLSWLPAEVEDLVGLSPGTLSPPAPEAHIPEPGPATILHFPTGRRRGAAG